MGVVYAAHDERLDRPVAIKTIRGAAADPQLRERFWREARAAARLSHPHVCQLYEVGEHAGQPYIAMELLEGEPLAARLARGPLGLLEALQLTLSVLDALEALHRRGIVHRDLKPSNVFLTPHGLKLLDFGLAVQQAEGLPDATATRLTLPGMVLGTPNYMAPEQAAGRTVDARTDLFAVGAMLFEMLTGHPAFRGATTVDVLHAVMYEQPPAIGGSPAIAAVDRVVRRALAKSPDDRYPSAEAMAADVRGCMPMVGSGEAPRARAMTRLIVLPFRLLRPDPEIDFLAFSLPDAVTASLAALESLVVRSSLAAARYASDALDLKRLAVEAEVDIVLSGTLLRAGDQLRVSTQLVEAPQGTLIWTQTSQVAWQDIFRLQDDLVHRIVESLALPLSARERSAIRHDVPASATAYEFYLRANRLGADSSSWELARELYERCVEQDPGFAPAWSRLARIYRVLGKYSTLDEVDPLLDRAQDAFKRAFALNPDLSLAHNLYTYFEVERGGAREAMVRLLRRAQQRTADPELYAGLVHACRYVGLLDASAAAYEQARRLDPSIRTSVAHTFFQAGLYQRAIDVDGEFPPYLTVMALAVLHRDEEALTLCRDIRKREPANRHLRLVIEAIEAAASGQAEQGVRTVRELLTVSFHDPEGWYYWARALARWGDTGPALELLTRAVQAGFHSPRALEGDPWLDSLRSIPGFSRAVLEARTGHREAARAFLEAGGDRVLGVNAAAV
jgi:TolB-like protein/Tfp pilus assembly protein PilF